MSGSVCLVKLAKVDGFALDQTQSKTFGSITQLVLCMVIQGITSYHVVLSTWHRQGSAVSLSDCAGIC